MHLYCSSSPPPAGPVYTNGQGENGVEEEADEEGITPELMFTENDTNFERLWGGNNATPYVKDAFHDHIIPSHRPKPLKEASAPNGHTNGTTEQEDGRTTPTPQRRFINPENQGTKSGANYVFNNVPGNGGVVVVRLKLTPHTPEEDAAINDEELFDDSMDERRREADEFYGRLISGSVTDDLKAIMRQALGGMMW